MACIFVSGIVAAKLASSHYIQAAVVLHPGPITVDDINGKFETSQAYSM